MSPSDNDQDLFNSQENLPDEEIIRNFSNFGYRGFKEIKGRTIEPVIEIIVKNSKGHTIKSTGETREEAIESVIEMIDRYLDEL